MTENNYKVGDHVAIKQLYREQYPGTIGGRVLQLTSLGIAVKVQLSYTRARRSGEPATTWIDVNHLEKRK